MTLQVVANAIQADPAGGADIDHADLAALAEIAGRQAAVGGQGQRGVQRHRRADHGAIDLYIGHGNLAGAKQVADHEGVANLPRRHAAQAFSVGAGTKVHAVGMGHQSRFRLLASAPAEGLSSPMRSRAWFMRPSLM